MSDLKYLHYTHNSQSYPQLHGCMLSEYSLRDMNKALLEILDQERPHERASAQGSNAPVHSCGLFCTKK